MEHLSIKLESNIAKQVEKALKEFNYSTKTEFVRESIRDKLKELNEHRKKEKAWKALFAARGIFKDYKTSEEEFYKKREEFGNELAKELAEKYNIKI